ncbi:hypothetical protein HOLleu_17014 [Holothuria leucospilota]|uniref:Uncharacterized protein n=1 Tax=Holothuria leucospilota TaxID=206669 RepID=A0A9Q1C7A3_HOLLE|nr:hypothetical protein HOLleu_17014 [Holothuria leucospilota]
MESSREFNFNAAFLEFSRNDPTRTNLIEHDVDVGDATPIKQHPYRVNPRKRQHLRDEVRYMLDHDIIEPSNSEWSSPCILVPKPDGGKRYKTTRQEHRIESIDERMESSREFNFNAAFLEFSRSEVVVIHRLPSLVIIRSWNQFLRYSTLQVYYCTIVNVHALPALGPDQANIK